MKKQKCRAVANEDEATLERIRLDRTVRGIPDKQIAVDLGWPVTMLIEVAKRHGIERRKGPAISELKRQWDELDYRLPNSEKERVRALVKINSWLATQ